MKQVFIPILDNGHGIDTAGKRSPVWDDGTQLFEWEFNRDIVKRVSSMLEAEGIQYRILVPETKDVSLSARCKRANAIYSETSGKCFLISVHANAGGGTKCPAGLVENFFMDTRKDCAFIQSEDGRNRVSKVIFEAIKSVCYGRVI